MSVARRARRLTQDALADAADLDPTYIRKIEMGKKTPSWKALTRLAAALAPENADAETVRAILNAGLCVGRIFGRGLGRDENGAAGRGNKSISLKACGNVTLRDYTIQHGGWFGILATGVDNLTINDLKIDTNRDGMGIACCRNVHVSDCTVNSPSDDGICPKSSYGLGFARATENVTITNCQVSGYDEGTLLDGTLQHTIQSQIGRIKFGTESNGGFENITVSSCTFAYCRGLALEEVDGGKLEDVAISNITMPNVFNSPIYVRLGSRLRGPSGIVVGDVARVSIATWSCMTPIPAPMRS